MTLPGLLLRLMSFVDNYGTLVIVMTIIILMTLFLQKIKPSNHQVFLLWVDIFKRQQCT